MVQCPNCREEVAEPEKAFKNHLFSVEAYTCKKCSHQFKVTR